MSALVLFIVCTAANVILSTIKSIVTVKGGKLSAALLNAITYGFYTYVIVLTTIDGVSTLGKMVITFACNFVGVYIVKWVEEKSRKDKLWKIEATVDNGHGADVHEALIKAGLPHNYIFVEKWFIFNVFCATQEETHIAKEILKKFNAKSFVSENRAVL